MTRFIRSIFILLVGLSMRPSAVTAATVDFGRDVLPILSENCFQCHGPDEENREGGLRLDTRAGAFAELESGALGIVANDCESSEVVARVTEDDPSMKMPPPESGKSLSKEQIEVIRNWVEQGAEWSEHWAFVAPAPPAIPAAVEGFGAVNEIDLFVHARLVASNLRPSEPAARETLIRRLTFDLIGLPPTVDQVDAFLADKRPDAYEQLVHRLLDSPAYGEQMARIWLDSARYADTHGLHLDNERSIWPYREWVIDAFNRNMPFDQFTIEQLAGDLLPEPTLPQKIATGFNRCNVTTSEGGSIDDEYYVRYAVDRVETTATVWLGLTAGCAACHDHKFDPLTQKEFYELFSYFFHLKEKAMDGNALLPPPSVKAPGLVYRRKQADLAAKLAGARAVKLRRLAKLWHSESQPSEAEFGISWSDPQQETVWFDDQLPRGAKSTAGSAWKFVSGPEHPVRSGLKSTQLVASALDQYVVTDVEPGMRISANDRLFVHVYLDPKDTPETVQIQFKTDTWNHRAYWGADKGHAAGKSGAENFHAGELPAAGQWVRLEVSADSVGLKPGTVFNGWAFTQFKGTAYWDEAGVAHLAGLTETQSRSQLAWEQYRQRVNDPPLPESVQTALNLPAAERAESEVREVREYFLAHVHPAYREMFAPTLAEIARLEAKVAELDTTVPGTLVMEEREEPRQAHVLERGEYTLPREPVGSRVPTWIAAAPSDAPANRLGLARWLVSRSNPLPARVTVNRFWQQLFGIGLVKTSEDFGLQGERPSHPQLLDWLAIDFIDSGWDVKQLLRTIVMSRTYRQSSQVTADLQSIDPANRLLARGPRFRLDGEAIRDQALALSGLLVNRTGGKSVRPYQPEGLWEPVGFGGSNTAIFKQDSGAALYRRSMYTFWKRTSPPPSLATFDAPNRETCLVRRGRTNTPLQSLVLMNDVQFFEAARKFAERVLVEQSGGDDAAKIQFAFRAATARQPNGNESAALEAMLNDYRQQYRNQPEAAAKLISVGEATHRDELEPSELAAWTMLTHLLLNLHETVTKG